MMTLEEVAQLAESAQQDALRAQGRYDESKALHIEVARWRQQWEKRVVDQRDADGLAPYPDATLGMLSEMAYREHDPDTWQRYLDSRWDMERAAHAAGVTAAASQVTALHMNMATEAKYARIEQGWKAARELGEGEGTEE